MKEATVTAQEVLDKTAAYMSEADQAFVVKAYDFAHKAHDGQMRKSGETYIVHPIQVANILVDLKLDVTTIASAFLHDVVEDTAYTLEDMAAAFGSDVANVVDGVTKLGKVTYKSHEEQLAENHRKMMMAMSQDIRVILVKLADRLHNMRTLKHLNADKQKRISHETMDIYVPLSHRLGMSSVKWELEDLAFRYLEPIEFYKISHLMSEKRSEREAMVTGISKQLVTYAKDRGIQGEITGRPKHLYSIYRKMRDKKKRFDQIYDLMAVRCIVDTQQEVYTVLGFIHELWRPMPGRFKDYIANPKSNGYQSVHTTVFGPKGPVEFQIRTRQMHQVAEYGVAAHWIYKMGEDTKTSIQEMDWLVNLQELQQAASDDAVEFVKTVKEDIFTECIYVFTPEGDVRELPKESIPIDFAYDIHSKIGEKATGARVNGRIVPLTKPLKTGDQVEIITSGNSFGPSRDWIQLVKTNKAKNRIRQFFKNLDRDKSIAEGRTLLNAYLKDQGYVPSEIVTTEALTAILSKKGFKTEDELYAAIGFDDLSAHAIGHRLIQDIQDEAAKAEKKAKEAAILEEEHSESGVAYDDSGVEDGVVVEGATGLLVRLSKCCIPIPGDAISGYITKGRGVAVHRDGCHNLKHQEEAKERLIAVRWGRSAKDKEYPTAIVIYSQNNPGVLTAILDVFNKESRAVTSVIAKPAKDKKHANCHITFLVHDTTQLASLVEKVKAIPQVLSVKRLNG